MITSDSFAEKMQRCREYVEALEEERRKIQVFQRELPLCLELITQVIDAYKQQLSGTTAEFFHGQSECSGQTSSDGPVLELLPIKRTSEDEEDDDDEEQQSRKQTHKHENSVKDNKSNDKSSKKSDWLSSVQLWNQTSDPPTKEVLQKDTPRRVSVMEVKRNGGAFHPFKRDKSVVTTATTTDRSPSSALAAAASSTAENGGSGGGGGGGGGSNSGNKEEKEGQSQRKARRCWSPELHRRFLHALQQLGGSHVATPKQIRDLMKVDGLTNDEVKSHLQKYRLHTRRPTPPLQNNNSNPQAPQFVVVGGIWVPPPEYAAAVATTAAAPGDQASGSVAASNGIYAPIAAPPPPPLPQTQSHQHKQSKQQHSHEMASHSDGEGGHSSSPETSSSTHTSTASPAF